VLFGGPGFIDQVEHKLRAYTWNVVHRYDELVIDVREVGLDGTGARACFSSRSGFARSACGAYAPQGDVLHDEALLRVRGRFVDHDVPCLALAVEEKARVRIAKDRIEALGLGAGAWLRELKHAILTGAGDETVLDVQWRDRNGAHSTTRCVGELRQVVLEVAEGQRIGYVTDLCGTEANAAVLVQLLRDVDRLFIESVFLHEDEAHAARKNHLTARRAGEFARRVGARAVVPFHFSPRYEDRLDALIAELDAAWHGASDPAAPPASP
jgi:ribonuclease Z